MTGAAKRIVLEVLGWTLLVLGVAAIFLPGPGLLGIFAGLALLSQQYDWAERRVEPVRLRAMLRRGGERRDLAAHRRLLPGRSSSRRAACSGSSSRRPRTGGRWPTRGGCPAGSGPASRRSASALIAVGLIIYSYRRFHGHPEKADELRSDIKARGTQGRGPHRRGRRLTRIPARAARWDTVPPSSGDWRSGSALRSHRRGHWFEPSIAHQDHREPRYHVARLCCSHRRGHWFEPSIAHQDHRSRATT